MVKVYTIIEDVISTTMEDFLQDPKLKEQYEGLFENIINGNFRDSDISRLIKEIKLNDSVIGEDAMKLIRDIAENDLRGD